MTDTLHQEHLGACRTAFHGAPYACARVLLLGEDNPQSSAPEHALYPLPEGCAGNRLCDDILAVRRHTYLATWRTNLCVGKWSMRKARVWSGELLHYDAPWSVVVLLGRKVADACLPLVGGGLTTLAPFTRHVYVARLKTKGGATFSRPITLVTLPHPSGRNLVWNDKSRAAHARALLAEVVPDYPWGEALEPVVRQTSHCRNWGVE